MTGSWLMWASWLVVPIVLIVVLTVRRAGTRGSLAGNLSEIFGRRRLGDPVAASAQVVSASAPPRSSQNAGRAMCELNLVITVPGQPSVATDTACLAPLAKWPMPGMTLPVTADRSDLHRFRINWDEVATGWDLGVAQAHQMADLINNGPTPPANAAPTDATGTGVRGPKVVTTSSVTINGRPASGADLAPFETMAGMDLNGDGVIGGAGGTPSGAGRSGATVLSGDEAKAFLGTFLAGNAAAATPRPGGDTARDAADHGAADDPVARLERLSALHESGAISDAEYAQAKRQVLDQP